MFMGMSTLAVAAVAVIAVGVSSLVPSASAEPFKLKGEANPAWIYYSEPNDGGWTQSFDEARLHMEADLGIKMPYVEKIPEVTTQVKAAVNRLIRSGHNIILTSSYGYSDALKELSEGHPDVAFLNAAGTTNGPNLQSYFGRTYESQYLCGVVAGGLTKSNKIGYVAAHAFGLVNWTVNAYLLGARQVNPDTTLHVVYTGSWNDPVKERAAAEALVEQGVDVIGQHVNSPTPQHVAQEHGHFGTGFHRDMSEFSEATQCSSIWVWDRYLTPALKEIISGTWDPSSRPYGDFVSIANGGNEIACCGNKVPADIVAKVEKERQAIISGKQVFEGPIVDQDGNVRVAAGEVPSDADLWGMDYLIEGVVGSMK